MKRLITIILMLLASNIYSQITLIPDPQFENYLIALGIDSDGTINGQVLTSDIDGIVEFSFLGNPLITDITGIEGFASLEHLTIYSVNITEIDLSGNLNLIRLVIADVSLNALDLSNNIALEKLNISLNFSDFFFISPITYIDLSSNTQLRWINISKTYITHMDISNNINIQVMELRDMDELTAVNLKNGNNQNLIWIRLLYNDSLACVQVDDPQAVIAGTDPPYDNWIIENNPVIADDCYLGVEENLAPTINLYPNPVNDFLTVDTQGSSEITKISIYDVLGKMVFIANGNFNSLNLSSLKSGVYILKIETKNSILTNKIVKQ